MAKIDEELATAVEASFRRHLPTILKQMKLPVKFVTIGGKFNEDGINLEIGLVHAKSSEESSVLFAINQQNDGSDVEYVDQSNTYKRLLKLTGLNFDKVDTLAKAADKLGKKARCGTIYKKNESKYVCVGFSKKRDAFVMASLISGDCKYLSADKLPNFKRLKEKFDIS